MILSKLFDYLIFIRKYNQFKRNATLTGDDYKLVVPVMCQFQMAHLKRMLLYRIMSGYTEHYNHKIMVKFAWENIQEWGSIPNCSQLKAS